MPMSMPPPEPRMHGWFGSAQTGPGWATPSTVKATPYWRYARRGGAGGASNSGSTEVTAAAASSARARELPIARAIAHARAAATGPPIRLHDTPRPTPTRPAYIARAHAGVD